MNLNSILFTLLLYLTACASGWAIDHDSCDRYGEARVHVLENQIKSAFKIVEDAMAALNNPQHTQLVDIILDSLLGSNYDSYFGLRHRELVAFFFAGMSPPHFSGSDWQIPKGVLHMKQEVRDSKQVSVSDVIFYCDERRFVKNGGLWIDKTNGQALPRNKRPHNCKGDWFAFAWTSVPELTSDKAPSAPSQITICDWFLKYMEPDKLVFNDFSSTAWLKSIILRTGHLHIQQLLSPFTGYKEVDFYQFPPKIILHELMHTFAGGNMDDVKMHLGWKGKPFPAVAYGWGKSTRLARIPGRLSFASPYKNADTWALIGRCLEIIGGGGGVSSIGKVRLGLGTVMPRDAATSSLPPKVNQSLPEVVDANELIRQLHQEDQGLGYARLAT